MTRTSPRTISRISRTALLVVLATGAVGVSSVLTACSADAGSPLITSHKGSKGTDTSGTDTTGASTGSSDGTGTSTGTPDNTGGSSATPGDTSSTGTGTGTTPAPTSTSTTPTTPPAAQDFDIALAANKASMNLAETTTFQVTIAPKGYVGDVALSVTGLPTGATGTFSADKVALTASAGGTSTLTIKTTSGSTPTAATGADFKIVATAGTLSHEATPNLVVVSKLVIQIPVNSNTNLKNYDDIPLVKGAGNITVVWNNATNDVVTIHRSNTAAGLNHGSAIQPGGTETRTVTAVGKFPFYTHNGKDTASPGFIDVK